MISHDELINLAEREVIDCPIENVNGSSIDVTIQDDYLTESNSGDEVDMTDESISFEPLKFSEAGLIYPGEFILAATVEKLNLPLDVSALLMLKSSVGRNGLEHMNAGWIDPGFEGAITLEFKNVTRYNMLKVTAGMKIAQIVFFNHDEIPNFASYEQQGRYQGQVHARVSRGSK